jgi:hypothetical protein
MAEDLNPNPNLQLYNAVRSVPESAKKTITEGRMKGKTDINPMWRIKTLTEYFGPCGVGWKYEIKKQWLETTSINDVAAFVNIDLYIKYKGEWSEAIPGHGGNMFEKKENSGRVHVSDECYKMALTDAISVSCKALGIGADVYWHEGTKYTGWTEAETKPQNNKPSAPQRTNTPTKAPSTAPIAEVPPLYNCTKCKVAIPEKVYKYSIDKLGTGLCMKCQKEHQSTAIGV